MNGVKLTFFIKYFLFQRFNRLILISFWVIISFIWRNLRLIIIFFFIFIKIGIPPFHIWLKDLIKFISFFILINILIIQKFPIFFLFINLFSLIKFRIYMIIIIRGFISLLGFYNQNIFNILFFYSSIIQRSFILTIILLSKKRFYLFFFIYSTIIIIFIIRFKLKNLWIQNIPSFIFIIIFVGIIIGLPLSPFFLIKFFFLSIIIFTRRGFIIIFFILIICLSQIIYFLWIIDNIESNNFFIFDIKNNLNFIFILILIFFLILLFFI